MGASTICNSESPRRFRYIYNSYLHDYEKVARENMYARTTVVAQFAILATPLALTGLLRAAHAILV